MQPLRILLVDDHTLFRESLARLLASEKGFEMAGLCGTLSSAFDLLAQSPVDIVLLDFDLGQDQGIRFFSLAKEFGFAGKILIVTAGMDELECRTVLHLGASGIFLKHDSPIALVHAIRSVATGESWLSPQLAAQIANETPAREAAAIHKPLSEREDQVLHGIFEGLSNKEIAAQLSISESAVKAYLQQLFAKLKVRTRSQLVRAALENSLGTAGRRI